MSENFYQVQGYRGGKWCDYLMAWQDCEERGDGPFEGCLCSWPDVDGETISPKRLRSLALLGAATVLAQNRNEMLDAQATFWSDGTVFVSLPDGVPQWVRDEILRLIPEEVER